jgi:hypothetical protein
MSDPIILAIIAIVPGALAALASLLVIFQNMRNHDSTKQQVTELSVRVDGALEKLMAASENTGRVAEAADQHQRDAVAAKDIAKGENG